MQQIYLLHQSVEKVTRKGGFLDKIQYHIWKDYEELADDARYTPKYAEFYKRRKKTIERIFADAKENTLCVIHLTAASPKSQIG